MKINFNHLSIIGITWIVLSIYIPSFLLLLVGIIALLSGVILSIGKGLPKWKFIPYALLSFLFALIFATAFYSIMGYRLFRMDDQDIAAKEFVEANYILVEKLKDLKSLDMVLTQEHPDKDRSDIFMLVLACPGDTVRNIENTLIVNSKQLEAAEVHPLFSPDLWNEEIAIVPENYCLVFGNRFDDMQSRESYQVFYLPKQKLLYKTVKIYN